MELTWLGHDSFKIKAGTTIVYIDPYAQGDYSEKADVVFVTHDHFDHFNREMVERVSTDATVVVGPQSVAMHMHGVVVLRGDERKKIGMIEVQAVPAYNTNKKFHPAGLGVGYRILVEKKVLYHAGDTDVIPEMKAIKADIALLPVSGTYVMTAREAVDAVKMIHPKIVIPMHYGSIVGTTDDAELFKDLAEAALDVHVIVLQQGETVTL